MSKAERKSGRLRTALAYQEAAFSAWRRGDHRAAEQYAELAMSSVEVARRIGGAQ